MGNNIELTDEQLEQVTGGSENVFSFQNAGNELLQLNLASAPTANVSGINFGDLSQSGATVWQGNSSTQTASNS
jgi:bacteriocin-like protein